MNPPACASDPQAVVIGAGFGGLAAALRLRVRGYRVCLLEQGAWLGGRARVLEHAGGRFDAGPTLLTAPQLIDELFALGGQQRSQVISFLPVSPGYRFYFPDGERFDYGHAQTATLAEIARISPGDCAGYRRLLAHSHRLCALAFDDLAARPCGRVWEMARLLPRLLWLGGHRSVYGLVARHIRHPGLRRALCIHPLLIGGNPYQTTAVYSLIHAIEDRWGIWYPAGGMGALVAALGRLLERQGVAIRRRARVTEILTAGDRVTGVRLADGSRIQAGLVVANVDPPTLYRQLLPSPRRHRWSHRRLERLHYSMGLFVLYFATRRRYPEVPQHNILLGEAFRSLLREVFDRGRLPADPSLYVHRPGATDPAITPPGQDLFYALMPVPNLQAPIDWEQSAPRLRARLLELLERRLLPGLRHQLVGDCFLTPEQFREDYLSHHGTGFSIAPRLSQSAWFRFPNRDPDIAGLYLVGAGTHPGAGIPGVLSSAKVLDHLIPEAR